MDLGFVLPNDHTIRLLNIGLVQVIDHANDHDYLVSVEIHGHAHQPGHRGLMIDNGFLRIKKIKEKRIILKNANSREAYGPNTLIQIDTG